MSQVGVLSAITPMDSSNLPKGNLLSLRPYPSQVVSFRPHSHTRNPSSPTTSPEIRPPQPRKKSSVNPDGFQGARELLNRIPRTRPFPPIFNINTALGTLAKRCHYAEALSHFGNLQSQGVRVNFYTLSIAINCYCHVNRVGFGFSLLGGLFKRGYKPHVAIFNTLLRGLISEDKAAEAVELFEKLMRRREIEPNEVTYGTIIIGLCKKRNTGAAVRWLRIMEEGSCKPNTVVYNTIIDGHCKDGMVDDALSLFCQMKEKGVHPDVVTYSSLIHG
ncbi:putative pentatricopeptide repeat-containing protein At1g12700, mitochondrial [Rhododendron vialii]|uniref:putative pentatricopeptide repeat-containing protein At1g12700, mitochondrial n=1 Tax=Rhododendron vialii TaxID=182163 RepID=UPI00265EB074|nr:putative pentatricopeptide repeat-containing protein At1g12700, mitochondrial [Rhododendron vialii]